MAQRRLNQIILSFSLHLFQLGKPIWCKPPNLHLRMCHRPEELIVVQKWSQQHLSRASKRTRRLSARVSLNTDHLKKLKETRQVTQNNTNFSPGHKAPSNIEVKKKLLLRVVATVCSYTRLYSLKKIQFATGLEMVPSWWESNSTQSWACSSWPTPPLPLIWLHLLVYDCRTFPRM